MFPAQISRIDLDEYSRCDDRTTITAHGKSSYPNQKTDVAIQDDIYLALWKDNILRAMEYDEIDVHVKNGVVYLSGHIVSTASKNRIANAIRAIPGILGINNKLVMDDELILTVASSLGALEHTYACKFFTGASHGVVSLNGIVGDENVKLLAEKCAASNPNVRGVMSHVQVKGSEMGSPDQPFLQPIMGEAIYFLNGVSGVVRQVIINPNNRRVTAMTIQGNFNEQRNQLHSLTDGEARLSEQLIVVSIDAIRYMTKVSGFLHINSSERNRYLGFDPASFSAPDEDWVPPYPYCSQDVLFPVESPEMETMIMQLPRFPFTLASKEQLLWEQILANDSLGG